jgi:fatty acid desaturase
MCRPPSNKEPAAAEELSERDAWLTKFDFEGFSEEIRALGKTLEAGQGEEDVAHLNKMILWSNVCAAVGLLTMGLKVNIVTIFCLSTYIFTRWAMIAHHTCHGGYEKCHPNLARWSRFKFALGTLWRRWNDWFDWMMPEAWNVEHNNRHHYNLSELTDPDLVENNLKDIRDMQAPIVFKYAAVAFVVATWKWFYYAPNTYKELKLAKLRREGKKIPEGVVPEDAVTIKSLITDGSAFFSLFEFLYIVVGPYFVIHFFITPLPWFFLGEYLDGYSGKEMYVTALKNLFLADIMSNMHSFLCIVTNHAGDDMYRFRDPCRAFSGSFFLRQVLASANYEMGTDLNDFMHGYLNYQVEHHLWPNLSMRSYQKAAPEVQKICAKYSVPYVKHNVFWRLKKTVDIMVGSASMPWFPEKYEAKFLEIDVKMESRKTK